MSTRPSRMSATSSPSDDRWSTGEASTGSVYTTVRPILPRTWFIACARAWTMGGCASPAMTTLAPLWARRSAAIAPMFTPASGAVPAGRPATPTAAASASACPLNLSRRQREPVIGARPGRGGHGLDDIEPVHPIAELWPPPGGVLVRVAQARRSGGQEIGIDGHDDVGLADAVLRIHHVAEREARAGLDVHGAEGIPAVPLGLGISCEDSLDLGGERRRAD